MYGEMNNHVRVEESNQEEGSCGEAEQREEELGRIQGWFGWFGRTPKVKRKYNFCHTFPCEKRTNNNNN